jgi:hypothetical protein
MRQCIQQHRSAQKQIGALQRAGVLRWDSVQVSSSTTGKWQHNEAVGQLSSKKESRSMKESQKGCEQGGNEV